MFFSLGFIKNNIKIIKMYNSDVTMTLVNGNVVCTLLMHIYIPTGTPADTGAPYILIRFDSVFQIQNKILLDPKAILLENDRNLDEYYSRI